MTAERGMDKLASLLANLEPLILDDAEAAKTEAYNREAKAIEERRQRSERLEMLGVELDVSVHSKVIADNGLKLGTSMRAVQRWLWRTDIKPMLVLVGGRGCGKSVAAAYAAATYTDSVCWYSANDLVRFFSTNHAESLKEQKRAKFARLTVLDDVATEGDPVRMCAALIDILEKRKQKKTIVTTNNHLDSDKPGLESWLTRYPDPRLHSRLAESAVFVVDNGPDLRVGKK